MVKIVVNKGCKVYDKENRRDAREGETVEVREIDAKILKHRGHASDVPQPAPDQPPPPPPKPVPPAPPPRPPARPMTTRDMLGDADEERRGRYRRRDLTSGE